ncbi:hypothetical protein MUK42_05194 [Musa troglodytarum]|uniref:Uncharacterized protein n=1 Tax=Musa troglodytarum TaxID=320322 RepID=A0A9E7F4H2_9LILI|nr:hypothetical protein MUK42_05194 [Musa troglodytarum]
MFSWRSIPSGRFGVLALLALVRNLGFFAPFLEQFQVIVLLGQSSKRSRDALYGLCSCKLLAIGYPADPWKSKVPMIFKKFAHFIRLASQNTPAL